MCGKYCIKDSVLVVKLMEKLQIWNSLVQMAYICNVQPFTLYTQGQQVKVFSQIYKYCFENNVVVEKDGYITAETDRYVGAYVFEPIPGCYDRVVPFDFSSLYPSVLIAYNIDYSTLVLDPSIPDEQCHVMEWNDCVSCIHDPKIIRKNELTKYIDSKKEEITKLRVLRDKSKKNKKIKEEIILKIENMMKELKPYQEERSIINKTKSKFPMCAKRYYRFLKEPKGVVPTILENLLNARKETRNEMKKIKEEIKNITDFSKIKDLNLLLNVLDKRQLAYKISGNSVYGALGVRRGYLPCLPLAMCCTYIGRKSIEMVSKVIPEKYGGKLIYGD
jgi:DNA polymerase elongation subunit (family B)